MRDMLLSAFAALLLAQVTGLPEERFSAVRRLGAQQYKEDYNLLAPEHGPPLVFGWHSTARPPFSWEFQPTEPSKPESTSSAAIPVVSSSYFASRRGKDKPAHLVSPSHESTKIDNPRSHKHEPNASEVRDGSVTPRKSRKKKKGRKSRMKNSRHEAKLASNCTEAARSHAQSELCEAQLKQIKKQRAMRRKKKRRMKELRKERQRKKRKGKLGKQVDKKVHSGTIPERFFSFQHVRNSSHHSFLLTSASNGSARIPEEVSGVKFLDSKSESNSRPANASATMTNEVSDHSYAVDDAATNVSSTGNHRETAYAPPNDASADLGSNISGRRAVGPRLTTTQVTENPVQGRGPGADVGLTTEGMVVVPGEPTTSSPDASLRQRPDASGASNDGYSQHNRVDVGGPLLGPDKGDMSCVVGRFLPAPAVKHADVKYIRSGEGADGTLVAWYECQLGYRAERVADYRLWCSSRSWKGEVPRCVPSGEELTDLDSSAHCAECDQVCHQRPGEPASCSCYRGFRPQGTACLDINECSDENGGCQDECVNTAGSFFCTCPQGFRVDIYGKTCRDINECLLRNGHGPCQDTCTNLHGGYSCSCDGIPGTRLSSDNHTCDDVDECAAGTAGCSHTCLNTLGRVFCLCPPGFELGPDWKTCQDIDECLDPQLQGETCDTECVNTVGSYHCKRPGDQPAEDCRATGVCSLRDSATTEGAQVVNETCPEGLQLGQDSLCVDVDECGSGNGGCAHHCVNSRGSYRCRCKAGFALDIDGRSCIEAAMAAVCPPLDTPVHGYLQCERQTITVQRPRYRSRRRVVNHAGTVCRLRCPLGSGLRGAYVRTCTTSGHWAGPQGGVCLKTHYLDTNEVLPSLPLKRSLRGWEVYQYPRHRGNYIRVTFGFMVPTIKCPDDVTVQLPTGQRTVHVVYEQPYTSVDWFRHVVSEPMWGKQLEADVPLGAWTVKFTARHPVSHLAASCTLAIAVTR